jgi:signal transduction histidine kinase
MADQRRGRHYADMSRRVADALLFAGLVVTYVLAARIGLSLDAAAGFASLVWPSSGIALAALLLLGVRFWPAILIGAFIANLLTGAPALVALGIGCGNTGEALVATLLLRRVSGFSVTLENVRSVLSFVLFGAVLSTLVSATIGTTSLHLGHIVASADFSRVWSMWWVGDLVGDLIWAPVFLVWARKPHFQFTHRAGEGFALGAMILLAGFATFFSELTLVSSSVSPFFQAGLLLLVMLWAAMRFGQRGSATAAFGLSKLAIIATVLGYGPFVQVRLSAGLLPLQTFMATLGALFLLLGAIVVERKLALHEARLAQAVASQANVAKSEFLAIMSHELRTPLNAISGFAQLLVENVHGTLNEKQADDVGRIIRNEKQLLAIVDELLSFVSLEKGEVTVAAQELKVSDAFDAVEPAMQTEFQEKHFVVQRALAPPQLTVHADPQSLQQILLRLLSNASKYTKDGGTITLGADRDGATVRIWVADTGIGISSQEIKRVFEPFVQGERGTTRRYSGIGLGLSIARTLARRMKGELTIASTEGSGTTASVVLPAA